MVVNAHGRPLCKHSKPEWQRRHANFGGSANCGRWCEWRTCVYFVILPAAVIIALLLTLVPMGEMFGFQ